jgi:hypothetical protein
VPVVPPTPMSATPPETGNLREPADEVTGPTQNMLAVILFDISALFVKFVK